MVGKGRLNTLRVLLAAPLALLIGGGAVNADDTEIYQATPAATGARPMVLILFDDSLSMNDVVADRPPYDPAETYVNAHPGNRFYWSKNGRLPVKGSNDFLYTNRNRCDTSIDSLADYGFFQTKARRWFAGGQDQFCTAFSCVGGQQRDPGWLEINSGSINAPDVECLADVVENNPLNPGRAPGYPQNTSTVGQEYGPNPDPSMNWGESAYTFYSAHYMDWYYDETLRLDSPTKLEVAQQVVSTLVEANKSIDFGLALFNDGRLVGDYDGGRIVQRLIPDMTDGVDSDRADFTAALEGTISAGYTPLCEATMEVYRYLGGLGVEYGYETHPTNDPQPKDDLAESPAGTYATPLNDCAKTFVILMTDGRPTYDQDANDVIEALTGKSCETYLNGLLPVPYLEKSCLPEIVGYMARHDVAGNPSEDNAMAQTYTIGYGLEDDEPLLTRTAEMGKGKYFPAANAQQLTEAFNEAILDILSTDTTFTSPAVAVDTFTRTESRNEVFFAMFKPDSKVNWPGNIKRLDIDLSTGTAVLVDQSRNPANPGIDPATGQIKTSATTFWSIDSQDGPLVEKGGVGALLKARDPATRELYSNTGEDEALQEYSADNMTPEAFGLDEDDYTTLYEQIFGVSDEAGFLDALNWGAGYDVADEDEDNATNDTRWVLSDMLHSKPLVVNYGARTNEFSASSPDLRIVVGTNAGFLHMFNNSDGQEDWAFFAKELAPVLHKRRTNAVSSQHVYGIDAPAVLYTKDRNKDGNLVVTGDPATSDQAFLYFGLRRGGRHLYAMDISDPESPELLWRIDNTMPGFAELGQTWSVPVVTRVPGYKDDDGVPRPVLIFGAGYDINKDSPGLATADAMGRGLFIVDAVTGELVWSVTPAITSVTNLQEADLQHSVAATVTALDSNGDELTDRIYFADTGGQVWRVDLPGSVRPDANQDSWRVVKLARVNEGTVATDRRFFNAPDVVRTTYAGVPFDAILIGSGDRTNPNDLGNPDDLNPQPVENQFYMFRDMAINPYFGAAPSASDCGADPPDPDFRCSLPLMPDDLYDVTPNLLRSLDAEERNAAQAALAAASGWRLDLEAAGEKSLARSLTIGGKVYFTTFSPAVVSATACTPLAGTGRLYVVNLANATDVEDFDNDGNTDRFWAIGELLPDTPSPHFGSDGEIRLLLPPGGGSGSIGSPFLTGTTIPRPYGSYWFQEEY
ncbi:MAG: hypothetical protein KDI14_00100 [Halioglobus sp.]|nr:hypothetical protein [Halioglobus sp.]